MIAYCSPFRNVLYADRISNSGCFRNSHFNSLLALFAVVLPNVPSLRKTEADENRYLSEFQSEVVELASVLNGDHLLGISSTAKRKRMRVKEADQYVDHAISSFLRASKEARSAGVDESTIFDFQSSPNTRNRVP